MKNISAVGFCMILSGCAVFNGTPDPIINVDNTIERSRVQLEKLASTPPKNCTDVQAGVNQALTALDLSYAKFVDDISSESKNKNTVTDFALIGLGLAGTAVGGASAKTILHAISTGVASANTSIDKNYFYEKTIPALVSQMNADRKEKLAEIVQRYTDCVDSPRLSYSWFEAVHDLSDYYSSGTLLGALTSIPKNAGERENAAAKDIHFTLSTNTPDKAIIRDALHTNGPKAIMDCWKKVNPELFTGQSNAVCARGTPNAARLINATECQQYQAGVRNCLDSQ